MLQLADTFDEIQNFPRNQTRLLLPVSTNPALPSPLAKKTAFLCSKAIPPKGFSVYLGFSDTPSLSKLGDDTPVAVLPESARYIANGDILRILPTFKRYRVMYRNNAKQQTLLLTERCNHYCLMCSQPPKEVTDDWRMDEAQELIQMFPTATQELGFTGGEPTLYGQRLIELLDLSEKFLPRTAVHLLTNGRRFSDLDFAKQYAAVQHHDLMAGIPLYSDDPCHHNYIVQAQGAFDETIRGILNLKRLKQRVELRVVLHAQTIERLPQLCEFIARNLLFVDKVALMGLEMMGFTKGNRKILWIDSYDYRHVLEHAVRILISYGIATSVYNHQLCVVTPFVRQFAVSSISDWKREYLEVCNDCDLRADCGGFFTSGVKRQYSKHIVPVKVQDGATKGQS